MKAFKLLQTSPTVLFLALLPQLSSGFITTTAFVSSSSICCNIKVPTPTSSTSTTISLNAMSRRNFMEQLPLVPTSIIAIAAASSPLIANAKEEPAPITQQTVTEAFDAIRYELSNPSGVVTKLTKLINDGNSFEEIMQFTKESDAYFRRAKVGKARKLLTDKELKSSSIQLSNAITFDLIGINRASRPGQQSKEEQLKYLDELKKDIESVLELEKTIVIEE